MKPDEYYQSLSKTQRNSYAIQAGTTLNYLVAHVFRNPAPMRRPSNRLLIGLARASNGNVTLDEAIDYFLVQPVKSLAADIEVKPATGLVELKGFDKDDKGAAYGLGGVRL